jgi:cytochrome c oxidase subunit III
MLTAMVIAILTAITAWWFLVQRLREKPWTKQGVIPTSQETLFTSAPKIGLWVFLAVVTSLFGLFSSAYFMRLHDAHGEIQQWSPIAKPSILWINTLVLVLASGVMQMARNRADRDDLGALRSLFTLAAALTLLFLAGQVFAWMLLEATGRYGPGNPAYAFFILLTAAHGLHLVGGLFVLARATVRVWRPIDKLAVVTRSRIRLSVQLCTTYWHWLLLIWLGLFALLLST